MGLFPAFYQSVFIFKSFRRAVKCVLKVTPLYIGTDPNLNIPKLKFCRSEIRLQEVVKNDVMCKTCENEKTTYINDTM
jgi:hypothetical protein